ncbi:MAG: DUF5652 family protein [Nanoarchaeota archaeon]|nr:DUF5652 family protein [Nanoarchaeota archaeon]
MTSALASISDTLGISPTILIILLIWTVVWKGFALWKSARLNQPAWFIIILIVNTFGVLEVLYIFLFSKIKLENKKKEKTKSKRDTTKKPGRNR